MAVTRTRLERYVRLQYGLHGPSRYLSKDASSALYSVLSLKPPVFYVGHWMDERLRFSESLKPLYRYLRTRRAYFLVKWEWSIEEPDRVAVAKWFEERHCRKHPGHRFIHLCNTRRQHEVFVREGLQAVFCSQNALCDERVFRPLEGVRKRFDAVYDARLKSYKRHELAARVESLALVYAFSPGIDDGVSVDKIRRSLTQAHVYNEGPDGYAKLTAEEVNRCLNECRVGLCLSAVEGGMYASSQYLLTGLPVVSTRSQGGRDVFFEEPHVLIVEDDVVAVKEGVQALMAREIRPAAVRAKTLEKMAPHRATFVETVQRIYELEDTKRNFADEFPRQFFHKMLRRSRHADVIAQLEGA